MDQRSALAQLFLAGRSPEEQQARILQQRHDAGLSGSGGAFPSGPPGNAFPPGAGFGGADMTQAGPWGAGQDAATTSAIPQLRPNTPDANVPIPQPRPDNPFSPDLAVSPQMPPDPMAASAPTNNPPVRPQMPPPVMGVPPDLRGTPQTSQFALPTNDLAVSPPRPPDPMRGAPTEIGAYEALARQRSKKPDRKAQTKTAQKKFRDKLPQNAQPRQS